MNTKKKFIKYKIIFYVLSNNKFTMSDLHSLNSKATFSSMSALIVFLAIQLLISCCKSLIKIDNLLNLETLIMHLKYLYYYIILIIK